MKELTQTQRLEKYLKEKGSVGPLDAWKDLGIYRLSARVFELRRTTGLNVVTEREEVTNQFGEKTTVARYVLQS